MVSGDDLFAIVVAVDGSIVVVADSFFCRDRPKKNQLLRLMVEDNDNVDQRNRDEYGRNG